jgi:hypothetical protein
MDNDDSIWTVLNQRVLINDSIDMSINFENRTVCILKLGEIECFVASDFGKNWRLPAPNIFKDLDCKLFLTKNCYSSYINSTTLCFRCHTICIRLDIK